jgi:outer membrane receptor protein involved in Fe transport
MNSTVNRFATKDFAANGLLKTAIRTVLATVCVTPLMVTSAYAQSAPSGDGEGNAVLQEVTVTGSRIRRTNTDTEQPINVVGAQAVEDRGYINAAQAINDMPIIGVAETNRGGQGANVGTNFVNLFNLGSQRTLTLVNGRRFVSSNPAVSGSNPGSQVDLNNIPASMIDRVEIVQATGAATYGSDSIAGVVNILLKKDFEGFQVDAQWGDTSRNDYRTNKFSVLAGTNFADGCGNVAFTLEHTQNDDLFNFDRRATGLQYNFGPNPLDTSRTDGIPANVLLVNRRAPYFTEYGLPLRTNAPSPSNFVTMPDPNNPGGTVFAQFGPDGDLHPYDTGIIYNPSVSSGGDGSDLAARAALISALKRDNAYLVGGFDLTDRIRLTTELSASRVRGVEPDGQTSGGSNMVLFAGNRSSIPISTSNPYLSDQARGILEAQGITNFFLSRTNYDLVIGQARADSTSKTYREVLAIDGDFTAADRDFFWNVSFTAGQSTGENRQYDVYDPYFRRALNVAVAPNGEIVCADKLANPTSTDPGIAGCRPLNIFAINSETRSPALLGYLNTLLERTFQQEQTDWQGNFGGDLWKLPSGMLSFAAGVEYRKESATSGGNEAILRGNGRDAGVVPISGSYTTKEAYAEVSVPIFGEDFSFPMMQALVLDAAYRTADNSRSGKDDAWNVGLRWTLIPDVVLRGSISRTFRQPSTLELFLPRGPSTTRADDPCDLRYINLGANPAARRANCAAAFQALGLPPDFPLISTIVNAGQPSTVGGNPNLENEFADSWTAGTVLQPRFAPGLTVAVDYVHLNLQKAISSFTLTNILVACYDSPTPNSAICNSFTRSSNPDPSLSAQIISSETGYVNAGYTNFRGVTYTVDYDVPLDSFLPFDDPGRLQLGADFFNTKLLETSVSGLGYDLDRVSGELNAPNWKGQIKARYTRGNWTAAWFANYIGPAKFDNLFTIEDRDLLGVPSYMRHDFSAQYRFSDKITFRGGVNNVFDKEPPILGGAQYDIFGRFYFVGAKWDL